MKSISTLRTSRADCGKVFLAVLLGLCLSLPGQGLARWVIDINQPRPRIKIAIPDFKNLSQEKAHPEMSEALPEILSNDLDLCGFFEPMDKKAFLADPSEEDVRFREWSVIGAELLVKAGYITLGQSLEVEMRLYDVTLGQQVLGKRVLGKINDQRHLIHRLSNEIYSFISGGQKGIFLSRLAFVGTATGNKEIYVCDFDGFNVQQITSDKSIALLPRWSPKGDKISFTSYKEGGPMLYLKDISSGQVKKLSGRKGLNIGASWAPDGNSMAFTMSEKDNVDIYSIDLEGKIISRLTSHWGINVSPTFSPDGTKMAFVSNRSGSPQIYVRYLAQEKDERLTFFEGGKYNTSPAWSSRNRIAFTGASEGRFDIFTIDPDGGNLRNLTKGNGNNEDPCWSADGNYLIFSSNRDGAYRLYMMLANGQNQRKITTVKGQQTSPSWSLF